MSDSSSFDLLVGRNLMKVGIKCIFLSKRNAHEGCGKHIWLLWA